MQLCNAAAHESKLYSTGARCRPRSHDSAVFGGIRLGVPADQLSGWRGVGVCDLPCGSQWKNRVLSSVRPLLSGCVCLIASSPGSRSCLLHPDSSKCSPFQ